MPVRFKKKAARTTPAIPTAALPDIIFTLLTFFLVTTVFRDTDLLVRATLPTAEAIERIEQKRLVTYLYVGPERLEGGRLGAPVVQIDDAVVEDLTEIRSILYRKVLEEPRMIVSLRVDEDVEAGLLYDVQQELREAETLRINYSATSEDGGGG